MRRVEFKLGMPGNSAWNGKWSGEGRNHTVVRTLADAEAAKLNGGYWTYAFGDGWLASVSARVLAPREKPKESDGFSGYDWMVSEILELGRIRTLKERVRP